VDAGGAGNGEGDSQVPDSKLPKKVQVIANFLIISLSLL
jgi:hypothetical protein